jgi:hypothetical protein
MTTGYQLTIGSCLKTERRLMREKYGGREISKFHGEKQKGVGTPPR